MFPIQGVAHGLPAGARAVACLVADRADGVLVAARPIAQWPGKKSPSCVTTRRCKLWFFNGLRPRLHSLAARLFGMGVLGFDVEVLATFRLASGTCASGSARAGNPDADSSVGGNNEAGICVCTRCADMSAGAGGAGSVD